MAWIAAKVKGLVQVVRLAQGNPGGQYARTISSLTETAHLSREPTNERRKMSDAQAPTQ